MSKFLDNEVILSDDSVIKVSLKYQLQLGVSRGIIYEPKVDRYGIDVLLKIKGGEAKISIKSLYYLISDVILKKYLCTIQIDKIAWKLMTIIDLTSNIFIARLPINNCQGLLQLPLSKISRDHHFVYHLYRSKITPFKFMLKGVPTSCVDDQELITHLDRISDIFTEKLPIINENGEPFSQYFKFVRMTSSSSYSRYNSRYKSENFQEIDTAYPWGFVRIHNKSKPKRAKSRKSL